MDQLESATIHAGGVLESLCKGNGHTQLSRIGELIDNPLDQGATMRHVFVSENYLGVYDNGKAINENGLKTFLNLYERKERKDNANGKYNIGMTAAISSQVEANTRTDRAITHAIFSKKKNADVVRLYGIFHRDGIQFERSGNASSLERVAFDKLLELFQYSHGTLIVMAKDGTKRFNTDIVTEIVDEEETYRLHPNHFLLEVLTAISSNCFSTLPDLGKSEIIKLWHRNMHSNCALKFNNQNIAEGTFSFDKKVFNMVDLFSEAHVSQRITFDAEFSHKNVLFVRCKEGNLPPELESIKNVWCQYKHPLTRRHRAEFAPVGDKRPPARFSFIFEAVLTKPMAKQQKQIGHRLRYYERCGVGISQHNLDNYDNKRYIERIIWNLLHNGFDVNQNKSQKITIPNVASKTLKSLAQYIIRYIFKDYKEKASPAELEDSDEDDPEELNDSVEDVGEADGVEGEAEDVEGEAEDVEGEAEDVEGEADDVEGEADDVEGEADDVAGEDEDVAGEAEDVSEAEDVAGAHVVVSAEDGEDDSEEPEELEDDADVSDNSLLNGSVEPNEDELSPTDFSPVNEPDKKRLSSKSGNLKTKRRGANEKTLQKVLSRQRGECAVTSFKDMYLPTELDHHNNDRSDIRVENMVNLSTVIHSMKHIPNKRFTKQNARFVQYYKEAVEKGGYANGVGYSPTAIADQMYQVMNSRGYQTECLNQSDKKLVGKEPDLFRQGNKLFQQLFPKHKVPTYQLKVTK